MNPESVKTLSVKTWTVYTSIGWLIGVALVLLIGIPLDSLKIVGQAMVGIGMGAGIGLMQWLVLRKHIKINSNWFWFSLLGLGIPYILFDIFSEFTGLKTEYYLPIATALGGLFSGYLLYRFILSKIAGNAKNWILYSFMGWLLAHLVTVLLFITNNSIPRYIAIPLAFVYVLIGGPILGMITGRSIVSILKNRQ
jgi:hypothetical protein